MALYVATTCGTARVGPVSAAAPRLRVVSGRRAAIQRRRRVVGAAAAVAFTAALALTGQLGALPEADGGSPSPAPPAPVSVAGTYVVQPGDTLWSIATRFAPDADPRPLVGRLAASHGDTQIRIGDRLDLSVLGV